MVLENFSIFPYFATFFPCRMIWNLDKLKSHFNSLCLVRLKCAQYFWRQLSNIFWNYLPLQRSIVNHIMKHKSPLPKDALCLSLDHWSKRTRLFEAVYLYSTTKQLSPLEKAGLSHPFWDRVYSKGPVN